MQKPSIKSFFDSETSTWTYIVWNESGDKSCAVIDSVLDYDFHSGRVSTTSADKIIEFITENNLVLQWILETHIHADHITAASYLKEKLGGKTAISNRIILVLKTWQKIFNNQRDTPLTGEQFDYLFADDEEFKIGSLTAKIIATPGHTPADSSYVIGDAIFVGDAIFMPDVGTGRCDFPGGSSEKSYDSIQKILSFPDFYRVFVGHDYPPSHLRQAKSMTTVAIQKAQNTRICEGITKDEYVKKRNYDDDGKSVPKLLFPSIQVNLRAGNFGKTLNGVHYIKIPVNKL